MLTNKRNETESLSSKRQSMYLGIVGVWAAVSTVLWIDFAALLHFLDSALSEVLAGLVAFLVDLGWLYGFYHIGFLVFTLRGSQPLLRNRDAPNNDSSHPVAVLHTVCNDFQAEAALSCVSQEHPNFHVYLLDDSTTEDMKSQVDNFSGKFGNLVTLIRRPNRKGFKAGNLNHALSQIPDQYVYVALADSDTFLPPGFLTETSQLLEANPSACFVQAVHVANSSQQHKFANDLGEIVRIGWNYYQPVRNEYGFPMCYGHGALIGYDALRAAGGFPEIVSEDIGLTLRLRRLGFWGLCTSDVVCGEDYPDDYYTFRRRLSRWVSADMECFRQELLPFLSAKEVNWVEKLDAVLRGLKVPLAAVFLPFVVTVSLILPLDPSLAKLISTQTILITLFASFAPYYCFIADMRGRPKRFTSVISRLTTIYCSSSLLLAVRTVEALLLRKSDFYVTGAKNRPSPAKSLIRQMLSINEAGYPLLGVFEVLIGISLLAVGIHNANLILIGLSAALALAPALYVFGWANRWVSALINAPLILMIMGILLSLFGGLEAKAQCLIVAGLSILLF